MSSDQDSTEPARTPMNTSDFYIGDEWFVQPSMYRITRAGSCLRVGPKVMHVLVCLAQTPGQVVSRDALMDSIWPNAHVVEESLTRCVSELRKIFGDDPNHPQIIETIRNVGYLLLAPVSSAVSVTRLSGDNGLYSTTALFAGRSLPRHNMLEASRSLLIGAGFLILLIVGGLVGNQLWQQATVPAFDPLQPIPLTSYPGEERGGALSPDGEQIAFTWRGKTGNNVDVYVKGIGADTLLRLTDNPARDVSPAWSPNGHSVAFIRRGPEGSCTLMLISALGGTERAVGSCGQNRSADLAWSPDGAWLAFSDRKTQNAPGRIALASPTTQEQRILTDPPEALYGDFDPSFSPDGQHLTFTRRSSAETFDLYVITLTSGIERRLTFDERLIRGHAWTPDGQNIVFASNRAGTFGLWWMPIQGGTPTWIATTGIGQAQYPSTARGSSRVVFENIMHEVNIRQIDLHATFHGEAQPSHLLVSTRIDVMPQFSPDNRRIAFISNRSGFFELWIADRDGANPVSLTSLNGSVNGDPFWSPDATQIAFSSLQKQQSDVYVLEVETGHLRQITSATSDDWVPRWSRDGRWLYFTSNRNGSWQIWKVDAAGGGEAVQITQRGGRAVSESEDGRFLYVARSDTVGIWRMPAKGGPATLILDRVAAFDWGSWKVVKDGLYFIDRRAPHKTISFFNFDTGEVTPQVSLPTATLQNITRGIPSLTVSPDRKQIAYAQFDRKERDIVMIEEF